MAPTPTRPSPRRFLPPNSARKPPAPSSLRNAHPPTPPSASAQFNRAAQFAPSPRFSSLATAHEVSSDDAPSDEPEPPTAGTLKRTNFSGIDSIEDPSQEAINTAIDEGATEDVKADDSDVEILDAQDHDEVATVAQSIEPHIHGRPFDLPHSPKRRRISPPSSPLQQPNSTTTASTYASHAAFQTPLKPRQRFLSAAPTPLPSASTPSALTTPRPAFVLPPKPEHKEADPLPDAFSPHRRGQKFVPGGMAAKMAGWVVEVGQQMSHSSSTAQARRGGENTESGRLIVRTVEGAEDGMGEAESGKGMMLCRAAFEGDGSGEVGLCLLSPGKRAHGYGTKVRQGAVVSVGKPWWDVEVADSKWIVGVEWRIVPTKPPAAFGQLNTIAHGV